VNEIKIIAAQNVQEGKRKKIMLREVLILCNSSPYFFASKIHLLIKVLNHDLFFGAAAIVAIIFPHAHTLESLSYKN
jgi:hypothetical protein